MKPLEISESGEMVTAFGLRAIKASDGSLVMDIDLDSAMLGKPLTGKSYVMTQIRMPEEALETIAEVIRGDEAQGKKDNIAYVVITNRVWLLLWFRGEISINDIASAKYNPEGYLETKLFMEGKVWDVRIIPEVGAKYLVATYDIDGKIV